MEPIEELMVSLQRLGRLLGSRQAAARVLGAAGVDVSQQGAALLRVLQREGRHSIASLAASASMDVAAVSREVKALERSGAVRRSRDADDARVTVVELTTEGRRLAGRLRAISVRHLRAALEGWSAADERRLADLLHRLVDDLQGTPVPSPGRGSRRESPS